MAENTEAGPAAPSKQLLWNRQMKEKGYVQVRVWVPKGTEQYVRTLGQKLRDDKKPQA